MVLLKRIMLLMTGNTGEEERPPRVDQALLFVCMFQLRLLITWSWLAQQP